MNISLLPSASRRLLLPTTLPAGTEGRSEIFIEEQRMFGKLSKLLATAFALLLIVSTMALAAEERTAGTTESGTIQEMNVQAGTLTLRSESGRTVELTAPTDLLNNLQTGDAVEVRTSGNRVIAINMKGDPPAVQPGGSWQQPRQADPVVPRQSR
jgi:hypothetical protein